MSRLKISGLIFLLDVYEKGIYHINIQCQITYIKKKQQHKGCFYHTGQKWKVNKHRSENNFVY